MRIIEKREYYGRPGDQPYVGVVLREMDNGQYAVHNFSTNKEGETSYFWGHYSQYMGPADIVFAGRLLEFRGYERVEE